MYLLHSLERENATLKDKLDTSVATTATPPSTTPPPEIIAVDTTTGRDDALIAALKDQSATQTAQITKFLATLSAGGWKRWPWRQRTSLSQRQVWLWRRQHKSETQILQKLQTGRGARGGVMLPTGKQRSHPPSLVEEGSPWDLLTRAG